MLQVKQLWLKTRFLLLSYIVNFCLRMYYTKLENGEIKMLNTFTENRENWN